MSENTIFVKRYREENRIPDIQEREIWRYAGYLGNAGTVEAELKDVLQQVLKECTQFSYKVCYRRMEIGWEGGMPVLPFECHSKDLTTNLQNCKEIILFAATVGLEIDRQIAKYQRISPAKALMMQAYGAERIESLCDLFCDDMEQLLQQEGLCTHPRYSPGYGDLPLEVQRDMFRLLDCNRQVGISLNESLLMTPSKSVTAIIGIQDRKLCGTSENSTRGADGCESEQGCSVQEKRPHHNCALCDKKDCAFRMID